MLNRPRKNEPFEKILDVDASMQGTLVFKDPVNLKINGRFEGQLTTKGSLTIGQNATVNANIEGEAIEVAGKVTGDIVAKRELKLDGTAQVIGNIVTPTLVIDKGAIFDGRSKMLAGKEGARWMSVEEVARYLEVDPQTIQDWASSSKIPCQRDGQEWRFEKSRIDDWVISEKIR